MSVSFNSVNGNYGNYCYNRPRRLNPDEYAGQYAAQNGLSLNEAKSKLKAQYGEPDANTALDISSLNLNEYSMPGFEMQNGNPAQGSFSGIIGNWGQAINSFFGGFNRQLQQPQQPQQPGHPQQPQAPQQPQSINPFAAQNSGQNLDPDAFAKVYAELNGIDLEKAKNELKEKYGEPKRPEQNNGTTTAGTSGSTGQTTNPNGLNPQEQALLQAGIPVDVIKQGDDAIMKYAKENNIALPQKESY